MFGQAGMAMPMAASSPGQSSPDSFEVEDDPSNPMASAHWPSNDQAPSASGSNAASQQVKTPAPMQKRRRVTRACDECRRKKIKCDGKQPCTHCTVYSYDCTYDQPSNRRRNPAPQYIEALEHRLQRAEQLLKTFIPNIDLNDPNFDSILQQRLSVSNGEGIKAEASPSGSSDLPPNDSEQDPQIRSMIATTGQLDLDERGYWDFHGGSSGAVFLRRMREQLGGLLGGDNKAPFLPRPKHVGPILDSPRSAVESPLDGGLPNTLDLPTKETAQELCSNALNLGTSLLKFIHVPSFYVMFERIYETPAENFGDEENRFLPLLYVTLALGCMFTDDNVEPQGDVSYKAGIDQGYKYFKASRQMMDITDCRDIISLQAILFMILFLQSSSNLSTCYSYIGVAMRSALRMGLHRNLSFNFNPIERETRRRTFWVIKKMDTYVAALLGFPNMLHDEDIDQVYPLEIDDDYITKDGTLPMPDGTISVFTASNAHTRLMAILAKVIQYIYPIKGVEESIHGGPSGPSYTVSHAKIKEIERDLQDWLEKLPMALRPGGEAPQNFSPQSFVRLQQLLRMAYAHVQMMLYRPFLHYVSPRSCANKAIDERSYACGAACVSVSRNIVHITTEMQRRGLLKGAYWFTMYTTFFAILSLCYFVLENADKPGSEEILADASAGHNALKALAKRSMAADRCSQALNSLLEQLPERIKGTRSEKSSVSKKRRSAPPNQSFVALDLGGSHDPSQAQAPIPNMIQRATTFPTQINTTGLNRQGIPFDSTRYQTTSTSTPDSAIRQNFQDLVSPAEVSAVGTPDSSSTTNSFQQQQQQQFNSFPTNNLGLPDLSAMMFPSTDPFAYPNQPMMEFDNRQQKQDLLSGNNTNLLDPSLSQNMFLSNSVGGSGTAQSPYDNLEGQLFGPLPPYLMGGSNQNMDFSQLDMSGLNLPNLSPQDLQRQAALNSAGGVGGMNFDELFAGGGNSGGAAEDWGNLMGEQGVGGFGRQRVYEGLE